MYCKHCGKKIDDDSTFCSFCGQRQSSANKEINQTESFQSNRENPKIFSSALNFETVTKKVNIPKYDSTYNKESDAIVIGIFILVVSLIFVLVGPIKFENKESYAQFKVVTELTSLILRICCTVWVVNIAKRQNRETFGWGLFAFLLPSIALIVIGTTKKIYINIPSTEEKNNSQHIPDNPPNAEQIALQIRYEKGEITFEEYKSEWNKLS